MPEAKSNLKFLTNYEKQQRLPILKKEAHGWETEIHALICNYYKILRTENPLFL